MMNDKNVLIKHHIKALSFFKGSLVAVIFCFTSIIDTSAIGTSVIGTSVANAEPLNLTGDNVSVPTQTSSGPGVSRVTLDWGKPVGWEIKSTDENLHRVIFPNAADQNNQIDRTAELDTNGLEQIISTSISWVNNALVVDFITAPDTKISVNWNRGRTHIDVTDIHDPAWANDENAFFEDALTSTSGTRSTRSTRSTDTTDDPTYNQALDGVFPLSSNQIHGTIDRLKSSQDATYDALGPYPGSAIRAISISLESSAQVETVYLAKNYVSTLVFLDVTGQPWPIRSVGLGDAFALMGFERNEQSKDYKVQGAHELRLYPNETLSDGNISISLLDLATPIVLRLNVGRKHADFRIDARIGKQGPNAKPPIIDVPDTLESAGDDLLMFHSGIPPRGAQMLDLGNNTSSTRAWHFAGKMWLKTKATLLSPAYEQRIGGLGDTYVYVFRPSTHVLLSNNGKVETLYIKAPARGASPLVGPVGDLL